MKKILGIISILALTITLSTSCKKEDMNKVPVADAGSSQTIQLPLDSVTLTGTATDADGKITGYLWSEVSGPNAATVVNPGSSSTKVRGLIAGTYSFQLMAIDDLGATGLDTVSVLVKPSPIQTVSFQPHQNANETNLAGNSTENFTDASAPELDAGAWTRGGSLDLLRGAFKFDLSSIPANATILSAKLTLYSNPTPMNGDLIHANAGPNNAMLIQRITNSWTSSATWQTQPGTATLDQIAIAHTNQAFLDLVDLDVTNMVKTMVTSGNYGFMLKLQNEATYNIRIFCSSKYSDQSKHPKLVVTYQ